MPQRTLRVRRLKGRGASRAALPRRAWERSSTLGKPGAGQPRPARLTALIVPTLRVGMPQRTLRVRLLKGRGASQAALPRRAWERSSTLGKPGAGQPRPARLTALIVPTLRVGMPQRTLRVRRLKGRGASRAALPRRAWERSSTLGKPGAGQPRPARLTALIVPTLRVGMPQRTLRVRLLKGRGTSRAALPRRAWERSSHQRLQTVLQMSNI
jgi:hypothetical protein